MSNVEERAAVISHLRSQYLGPENGPDEVITNRPDRTYLVGTLFPMDTPRPPEEPVVDELADSPAASSAVPDGEEKQEEAIAMANAYRPASSAVSFVHNGTGIEVSVRYGTYSAVDTGGASKWQRSENSFDGVVLTQDAPRWDSPDGKAAVDSRWRSVGEHEHLVTIALRNLALSTGDADPVDPAMCLYQVQLEAEATDGLILPYRSVEDINLDEEQEELALRYRRRRVYAVGHGTSVSWDESEDACTRVRLDPLPTFEVPAIRARESDEEVLRLDFLAGIVDDKHNVTDRLIDFINSYVDWSTSQETEVPTLPSHMGSAANRILERQHVASVRMRQGVELLAEEGARGDLARQAFRLAMLAMRSQMFQSGTAKDGDEPTWRPFQLGFILLCLESTNDEAHPDRAGIVDLIWFPTGGGKTEAYLALAAFEIFRRRLSCGSQDGGTVVLTRYTLRLLTTQQFQRAATLICAMEILRTEDEAAVGMKPFSIGLWVGNSTTPGTQKKAIKQFEIARKQKVPNNPFQLDKCPWCGHPILPPQYSSNRMEYGVRVSAGDIWLCCPDEDCPFSAQLPVEVIDERIYRTPPTFLLSTVDKFARLPFVPEAGVLLGGGRAKFRPPSLIIQDEMHLLSGPLGTTVAIYDAAVMGIIKRRGGSPKIVASTATIRAARDQVRGLSAREVALFPPSGLDEDDSYFARPDFNRPGRLYLGLMPQAFTQASSVVRSMAGLLEAPRCSADFPDKSDSYWTVVAYHNSLRELGRTISLVRDDVNSLLTTRAEVTGFHRQVSSDSLVELTSNVPPSELPQSLERLSTTNKSPAVVDVVASTNMLSVGIDVPRLSVMLMNGQPKTTSEYIQAASRVGRSKIPGIVVVLYRSSRPRDRSHYESFRNYHQALYKAVEPTSVTPWAESSRKRSLAAVFVAMVRHLGPWHKNADAGKFDADSAVVKNIRQTILEVVSFADPSEAAATAEELDALVREWTLRAREHTSEGEGLHYAKEDKSHNPVLMRSFTGGRGEGWPVMNSMRTVDANVLMSIRNEKD